MGYCFRRVLSLLFCAYIYVYIYTYIYVHIHTYICTLMNLSHIYTHIHPYRYRMAKDIGQWAIVLDVFSACSIISQTLFLGITSTSLNYYFPGESLIYIHIYVMHMRMYTHNCYFSNILPWNHIDVTDI